MSRNSEFERIETRGSSLGSLIMYYQKLRQSRAADGTRAWDIGVGAGAMAAAEARGMGGGARESRSVCLRLVKGVSTPRSGDGGVGGGCIIEYTASREFTS